jgi:hypothetical protein
MSRHASGTGRGRRYSNAVRRRALEVYAQSSASRAQDDCDEEFGVRPTISTIQKWANAAGARKSRSLAQFQRWGTLEKFALAARMRAERDATTEEQAEALDIPQWKAVEWNRRIGLPHRRWHARRKNEERRSA